MHPDGEMFTDFVFEFDCEKDMVTITAGEYMYLEKRLNNAHPYGLCYLHMQSVCESDMTGAFVKEIKFESK